MDILLQALGLLENKAIQAAVIVVFGMIPVIGGYSWVLRSIFKVVPTVKDAIEQFKAEREKAGDPPSVEVVKSTFEKELKDELGTIKSLALKAPGVQRRVKRRLDAALGADKVAEKAVRKVFAAPKGKLFE